MPRSILEFVFAFLVWSAAYFGVLVWRRSQEREREATEARRLAQEAQLQMLAYQLNPHFLFNALTSIRAMIDEDRARARQMVTQLAAFLRHALVERALETTTLAAELDALRGYLAIEQIRFEERLAIETHVDPAAESCAIPAFLIHPLLENAIKHGARDAGTARCACVSTRGRDGRRAAGRGVEHGVARVRAIGRVAPSRARRA